jgi:hypothetical protein
VIRTVLISLVLFAALSAPAGAEEWLLPRDGLSVHAAHPVAFAFYLDDYDALPYDVDVVVARDAALTDVVARYEAEPLDGFPTIYSATPSPEEAWTATPGTYYWQASYGDEVYPVRTLTVVPAPPPDPPSAPVVIAPYVAPSPPPPAARAVLAAGTAREIVRRAIAASTHRVARGLVYRCVSAPGAATCRPSWRDARFRYRGTLQITTGASGIRAAFTGKRTGGGRAARSVAWSTAVT